MRNATTRILATAWATLALSLCACDGAIIAPDVAPSDVGAARMALDIAPGISLGTISYSINGPGSFMKTGSIDVSQSSTISADVSPLPAGSGFSITLGASSVDGSSVCMGAAGFDVVARQTTAVLVHLLCKQPTKNGSLSFNGAINVCPLIDSLGASPSEVVVGAGLLVSGQGHDTDRGPMALAYQWTAAPAAAGSFLDAAASNTTFTCAQPGPVLLTLTLSDGDAGCVDTQAITVQCSAR